MSGRSWQTSTTTTKCCKMMIAFSHVHKYIHVYNCIYICLWLIIVWLVDGWNDWLNRGWMREQESEPSSCWVLQFCFQNIFVGALKGTWKYKRSFRSGWIWVLEVEIPSRIPDISGASDTSKPLVEVMARRSVFTVGDSNSKSKTWTLRRHHPESVQVYSPAV